LHCGGRERRWHPRRRILAASGLITVVPNTRHYPEEFASVITEVGTRADELFIDPNRLAVWAEGHGSPCALETVMDADTTATRGTIEEAIGFVKAQL